MSKTQEYKEKLINEYNYSEEDLEGKHFKTLEKMISKEQEKENKVKSKSDNGLEYKVRKKKKLDRDMLVPVANYTNGRLIYQSRKTGAVWDFSAFGSVDEMELSEIISMRSSYPVYLQDPKLLILDDEVVEYMGYSKKYEDLLTPEEVDKVFEQNNEEIEQLLSNAPNGLKRLIISRAKELIRQSKFDSMTKKQLIEKTFNIDLDE